MRLTSPWLRAAVLFLFVLAVVAMRWHTYAEPRERDLDIYAWIGHFLFQARHLYSDLVEIRPPLVFVLYALAEKLVGFGPPQDFLLGVGAALITLLGLYRLGLRIGNEAWIGVAAAMCWTALGSDLWLEANQPNTEVFVNAAMVWALVALWSLPQDRFALVDTVCAGLLFAAASLFKTVAVLPIGMLLLAQIGFAEGRIRALQRAALIVVVIGVVWALMFALLWCAGDAAAAWKMLVRAPAEYAQQGGRSMLANLCVGLLPAQVFEPFFAAQAVLLVASAAVLLATMSDRNARRTRGPLFAWMLGIYLAVAAPGHFFPHYYQLWLPWISLALPMAVRALSERISQPHARAISAACLVAFLLVWTGYRLVPQYRLGAQEWSTKKYGSLFVDTLAIGRDLGSRLPPTQRLFVFGCYPGLYEAAGREPPSGVFCVDAALYPSSRISAELNRRILSELLAAPPDLIVIDGGVWEAAGPADPIRHWVETRYRIIGDMYNYSLAAPRRAPSGSAATP